MTNFKIVDATGGIFESEFSSGVKVRANRKKNTYRIWGPKKIATKGPIKLTMLPPDR